jgi:hypothetical protein
VSGDQQGLRRLETPASDLVSRVLIAADDHSDLLTIGVMRSVAAPCQHRRRTPALLPGPTPLRSSLAARR